MGFNSGFKGLISATVSRSLLRPQFLTSSYCPYSLLYHRSIILFNIILSPALSLFISISVTAQLHYQTLHALSLFISISVTAQLHYQTLHALSLFISISVTAQLHYQTLQLVAPPFYTSEFRQFFSWHQTHLFILHYKNVYYVPAAILDRILSVIIFFKFIKVPKYLKFRTPSNTCPTKATFAHKTH